MAKVTPDLVKQLQSMSSARPAKCEAALKASKGDLDRALRALIASGDVTAEELDPGLTTKEHYALLELKKREDYAVKLLDTMSSFLGAEAVRNVNAELKELRSHFTGKLRLDDDVLAEGADARRVALEARKRKGREKGNAGAAADPAAQLARICSLIGVGIVHVLAEAKAGHAYVGFEMGCTWDEEHGLGVLTHIGRVVELGQADTAFVGHSVKKDGGKPIT